MRPSMVISGLILALASLGLFVALDGAAWMVMAAGGLAIAVVGCFIREVGERAGPPEGHRFCPFCSTPVMVGDERCGCCNGIQPWAPPSPTPPS